MSTKFYSPDAWYATSSRVQRIGACYELRQELRDGFLDYGDGFDPIDAPERIIAGSTKRDDWLAENGVSCDIPTSFYR